MNGKVVKYDKERGFGFIRCSDFEDDVFFHISDISDDAIPALGQRVSFDTKRTKKGMAAVNVKLGKKQKSPFQKYGLGACVILLASFLTLIFQGASTITAYLISINVATFIMYAIDKTVAGTDMLRVPERLLHWMALVGGSPAALLGQNLVRHKTQKKEFLAVYWLIVALQVSVFFFLFFTA